MDEGRQDRIKRQFGARVRQLRKAKKLSQEALALESGLDRSYVGKIERGESNVALVNIHRIADALKLDAAELFGE
ncbi:MAG TPA: helix-turn-helix transcriptional regulator [Allosphingosinicella sp.]|nr:helix-turn-helix transcriptional regulator [Allosphingosinicella sp.]